ncbi:MAG: aspartate--tRNA ligase [Vampirovibrionales bacterium]|nr:aspartate--tRNA ligase [Vampirovibrionales bacterium]
MSPSTVLEPPVTLSAAFTPRTRFCGDVDASVEGQTITVNGWVQVSRDLGGIIFIEVRDRSGLLQVVADPSRNPEAHRAFSGLRSEDVVSISGPVTRRPADTVNAALASGEVEVYPERVEIINRAKPLPFQIDDEADAVDEQLRLKYRYLDLRRPKMHRAMRLRHELAQAVRRTLNAAGFLELETPILIKATPEGARDYLVPSRVHAGSCYALPQSPQIFKQLFMLAGMERYYQIARCFRDEDLRADRQPEFTQIDIEMAFVTQEDVLTLVESLAREMFAVAGVSVSLPLPRMSWHDAMGRFGSDKPDLRYELEFVDLTDVFVASDFTAFRAPAQSGGAVKALRVAGAADYSRKELDDLQDQARAFGAKGLAYIVYAAEGLKSPILKYMSDAEKAAITERTGAQTGDVVFFMADAFVKACATLGRFREHFARRHNLIDPNRHELLWVVDFPMFDVDDEGRLSPNHHPFTSPRVEDAALLESAPQTALAQGYDLVYNGNEIGGGSIRIHQRELQAQIFRLLGLSEEEARQKFGFLLEAFEYGAPPHGGLALGFDRIAALLSGADSIRDVIAFPKTNNAACPLTDAPSEPSAQQLRELHMQWAPTPAKTPSKSKA